MSLGLDLSSSRAKLARALDLLKVLEADAVDAVRSGKGYAFVGDLDEESGWYTVKVLTEPAPTLSVIFGEFIHDIRSALDYIVSGLVVASGQPILRRHQFPIYSGPAKFASSVGTADRPRGPLLGIKSGFAEIEWHQPYNDEVGGSARNALALLQRLSNTDKHRAIVRFSPFPSSSDVQIRHNGVILEQWEPTLPIMWQPHVEAVLRKVCFAEPYPTQIEPRANMDVRLTFTDEAFPPEYPKPIFFDMKALGTLLQQATALIDTMSAL